MSAEHETRNALSPNRRDRELWWNLTRFGFLLIFTGGLVLGAGLILPDWSPSGAAPSLLQGVTTPLVCNVDCPGAGWYHTVQLVADVWLCTMALCLLVGGYNLARRSLERAGAAFGALVVVLLVGGDAAVVVIFLTVVHNASLLLQSTVLLALAGLGIALTGGILALHEPKPIAA
jgi:hypothetical protein